MVESGNPEKTRQNKTYEGKKDHRNYGVKGHEGKHKGQLTSSRKGVTVITNKGNSNNKNKKGEGRDPEVVGDSERYVVVITNVENDFAKVHREAIPRYCCLNEQHCHSHQPCGSSHLNETTTRRQCRYTVTPRTETRSVEVAFYGKADGDVSSVFLPVRTATGSISSSCKGSNANKQKKNMCKDATVNDASNGDNTVIECVKPPVGSDTLFATLEDMTMALRHKPYFIHPPKFLLNVPGKEDGDVLRESKRGKQNDAKPQQQLTHNNKDGAVEKEPTTKVDSADSHHLRQAAVRQADMITTVATTSIRMSTKDMQYQLRDIPGFITCWMLYPQHFRVVFATRSALFKAKQLLDQFAVDGNVRVALTLADGAAKEFTEHINAQENAA